MKIPCAIQISHSTNRSGEILRCQSRSSGLDSFISLWCAYFQPKSPNMFSLKIMISLNAPRDLSLCDETESGRPQFLDDEELQAVIGE